MEPVRICVVGGGRAGLVHGRNFAHFVAGATVTAVVEPVEEAGKAASAQLKARHFFSLQEALAHAAFDAVCIATPTYTHRDLVVQAARAGKHVFCEKPMALSVEEALPAGPGSRRGRSAVHSLRGSPKG